MEGGGIAIRAAVPGDIGARVLATSGGVVASGDCKQHLLLLHGGLAASITSSHTGINAAAWACSAAAAAASLVPHSATVPCCEGVLFSFWATPSRLAAGSPELCSFLLLADALSSAVMLRPKIEAAGDVAG